MLLWADTGKFWGGEGPRLAEKTVTDTHLHAHFRLSK